MLDGTTTVSLELLVGLVGAILVPGLGGFVALWFRIDNRFTRQTVERDERIREERAERVVLDRKLDELGARVEREFVHRRTLEAAETRLIAAIEKLDHRLEQVIDRVDRALASYVRTKDSGP